MSTVPDEEPPLLTLMKDVVDALGTLISGHVRLARAELGDDARRYARRGALFAAASSLVLVGYGLCCVSAALALSRLVGPALGFLVIGGAHLVGASVALAVLATRPPPPALDESLSALDRTVAAPSLTGARGAAKSPEDEDDVEEGSAQEGAIHVIS